ncbi:hypothetical protein BDZ85DRAFT_40845 [Elsinoe ampelina]|uniref:Uncharacterized protein n=1 Tax=Elsinoe ampelina TaxID=302913 RepID=A0A6A6G1Z7_9PEZI|nr:hypothetical protein BDZ85DRAFT_40845 [Elsinoe ampelina]
MNQVFHHLNHISHLFSSARHQNNSSQPHRSTAPSPYLLTHRLPSTKPPTTPSTMSCFTRPKPTTPPTPSGPPSTTPESAELTALPTPSELRLELDLLLAESAHLNAHIAKTDQIELQISAREDIIRQTRDHIAVVVADATKTIELFGEEIKGIKEAEGYLTYVQYGEYKKREGEVERRVREVKGLLGIPVRTPTVRVEQAPVQVAGQTPVHVAGQVGALDERQDSAAWV